MEKHEEEAVANEVEKRLDDIFGIEEGNDDGTGVIEEAILVDDDYPETGVDEYTSDEFTDEQDDDYPTSFEENVLDQNSPLMNLKGIVLSIDWEITDEIMDRFIEEVGLLSAKYSNEKIPFMYLQILDSVGRYIRKRKVQAHPESIKVLNNVYKSFENIMLNNNMLKSEKRKALYKEINRFKNLKESISRDKPDHVKIKKMQKLKPEITAEAYIATASTPPPAPAPAEGAMAPHEAFAFALEEIKQVIKAEFQAIRAELKLWREGG